MRVIEKLIFVLLLAVSVWANKPHEALINAPEVNAERIGKDSLKVLVNNTSDSPVCYHVPGEVDSYIENDNLYFIPKYQKNMAHMEGRPFKYHCLQPHQENSLKQEYSAEYVLKTSVDLKKINHILFTWGTPEEFKSLQAIGPRDYKKECEYLKTLRSVKAGLLKGLRSPL